MQWTTSIPMETVREFNFQAHDTVTNIEKHWTCWRYSWHFLTMPCVKWKQPFLISFFSWMSPNPRAPFDKNSLGFGQRILSINYPLLPRHKACNDRKLLLWPRLFLDSEPHTSTDLSCGLRGIKRIFDILSTKKSGICACRELLDMWQHKSPTDGIETWWNMIKHDKSCHKKSCDSIRWQRSLCLGTVSFSSLSSLHVMLSTLPLPDLFCCAEMTKATFISIPASSFAVVQTWLALALVVKLPLDKTRERNLLGTWSTMFGVLLTLLHRILCCNSLNLS